MFTKKYVSRWKRQTILTMVVYGLFIVSLLASPSAPTIHDTNWVSLDWLPSLNGAASSRAIGTTEEEQCRDACLNDPECGSVLHFSSGYCEFYTYNCKGDDVMSPGWTKKDLTIKDQQVTAHTLTGYYCYAPFQLLLHHHRFCHHLHHHRHHHLHHLHHRLC